MNQREALKRWIESDLLSEKAIDLLLGLINDKWQFFVNRDNLKKIGLINFDFAKPAGYMKQLRDSGLDNILNNTVFDYTNDRIYGRLENVYQKFVQELIKELEEKR